jgi:hypothetical protein
MRIRDLGWKNFNPGLSEPQHCSLLLFLTKNSILDIQYGNQGCGSAFLLSGLVQKCPTKYSRLNIKIVKKFIY